MTLEMCILTMHTNRSRVRSGDVLLLKQKLLKGENGDQMGAIIESVLPCTRLLIYRLSGNVQGLYRECGFHGSAWKAG